MKATNLKSKWYLVALLISLFFYVPSASADYLAQTSSDSIPLQSTNWDGSLEFDLFNPSLGVLSMVEIILRGDLDGSMAAESLDAEPSVITMDLRAELTLETPEGYEVIVLPADTNIFNASAFDGTIDFGGTSGATFPDLIATETDSLLITDETDLLGYYGPGLFSMDVSALGLSQATGAGNLLAQLSTNAGAIGTINYWVSGDPIPEPATMLLFGTGLVGLAGFGRKKLNSVKQQ